MGNGLPPTFVINLDDRPDRLAAARRRLAVLGSPIERISALSGPEAVATGLRVANPRLSDGEIGCAASHLRAYELLVERDLPCAFIVEDDVLPVVRFRSRYRRVLALTPPDFLLLQVGHVNLAPLRHRSVRRLARVLGANVCPPFDLLKQTKFRYGTHAYVVSNQFARVALEHCRPVFAAIDQMLSELTDEPTARGGCWVVDPSLALQDTTPSDVEPSRREGFPAARRFLP